jgi:hypothetical protein
LVSANGPAATAVFVRQEWSAPTTPLAKSMANAWEAWTTQGNGPGTTVVLYEVHGAAIFTNPGTFAIRVKAETGGTATVRAGSWLEYDLS